MITYETYLKYGGKRNVVAFFDLWDKYSQMRRCANDIAYEKNCMRHSSGGDSIGVLAWAAFSLGSYYNCDGLQRMALRGIYELSELNKNRYLREMLDFGMSIKDLF